MSQKSAVAHLFTVEKSNVLIRWLWTTHTLATIACLANDLAWLYKSPLLIAIIVSVYFYLRRYQADFQPYQIKCDEDLQWFIAHQNHDFQPLQILPTSVITVWLIVLHIRYENGKQQNLLILHDALSEKDYRALTVTLKMAAIKTNRF